MQGLFWFFTKNIFAHWIGWVAAVLTVVEVASHFVHKLPTKWLRTLLAKKKVREIAKVTAVFAVVIASFQAWDDEHTNAAVLITEKSVLTGEANGLRLELNQKNDLIQYLQTHQNYVISMPSGTAQAPPKPIPNNKTINLDNRFADLSNVELQKAGLILVSKMRDTSAHYRQRDQGAEARFEQSSRQDWKAASDQLMADIHHNTEMLLEEYTRDYKIDSIMLQEAMLQRLAPGSRNPDQSLYEYPVNPQGVEAVTDDLERLAKSLKVTMQQ